ncbi:MAG TPA: hypothetical protein VKW04_11765, partial [Planctomycetota bacterium]|nr:hypothetical protein [Planctomycetota bacterium]
MARLSLNCSCGWNFFIPGTTPGHEVTCPSCGQVVRIPGRKPGQATPQSAGEIALEVQRRQSRFKIFIGALVAAVIAIAAGAALFMGGSSSSDPDSVDKKRNDDLTRFGDSSSHPIKSPRLQPAPTESDPLPTAAPTPPPLYTAAQIL